MKKTRCAFLKSLKQQIDTQTKLFLVPYISELCRKTSLRYSLSLILISSLAPVCKVTSWTFVIDSLPLNGYLVYLAYKFYQEGDSASSRKLFRFSLIHLPTLILLMMVSKQAYKEKECPVTAALSEATAAATTIHSPPAPPVVFAISNENSNNSNSTNSITLNETNCNNDNLKQTSVNMGYIVSPISGDVPTRPTI